MGLETTETIAPFFKGIFTLPPYGQGGPRLLGGFCPACGDYTFPRPRFCPHCLGAVEEADLGSEGSLYSFTVIRTRPPLGLPQPYAVGFVDLKEKNVRIFCLLDPKAIERLRINIPLRLSVAPLGHDGQGAPRLRPYFIPQENNELTS